MQPRNNNEKHNLMYFIPRDQNAVTNRKSLDTSDNKRFHRIKIELIVCPLVETTVRLDCGWAVTTWNTGSEDGLPTASSDTSGAPEDHLI